ncbi:hypothetical protein N7475_000192 [Penicillium sp. IBT 31633x]|nr:hypothetical protein N7475_000192 [Penicillium sp. IBT 31633x]
MWRPIGGQQAERAPESSATRMRHRSPTAAAPLNTDLRTARTSYPPDDCKNYVAGQLLIFDTTVWGMPGLC